MSEWIVYSKDGNTERCRLKSLEYSGTWMGERAVTATFEHYSEVVFEVFDYIEYRGEVFELEAVPTVKKTSSFDYSYDLRFVSKKYELERCEMRDIVPNDNGVVYPTPLTFSFTGDVRYLVQRIQACLDALYGEDVWNIVVADGVTSEEKNITIAQQNCWNALALVNTTYGLNFYVKGRTITIGGTQPAVAHTFEYGKGNGLYEIERASDTEKGIVTKLRAYGGTRNLDYSYPKQPEWSDSALPVSFALSPLRLMLPSFKTDGKTDFVLADDATIAKYGIREASMVYDDIYPTITGATNSSGQAIDEIKAVDEVDDTKSTFTIYLYDLGFDLEEHLTTSEAQLSMKSGTLQGYTFNISTIEKQSDGGYKLVLGRNSLEGSDESGFYVPNADWNMKAGDKFVFLNILMPQAYIREAEERLLARAEEYLAQYGKTNFSYNIGLHDKFLVEHASVYDSLLEGSKLSVRDAEIGIDEDVTIQSITITENMEENILPQVKVTLNNEPSASTLDRIQGKLNDIANETAANNFSSQSELMAQYRKKLDKPFFDKLFVAVDYDGNEIASNDTTTPVAYIKALYDVAVVGGVTMYVNDKSLNIPGIYEGLPIDNSTLIRDDNGVLMINPDIELGGASTWDELIGKPTWIGSTKPSYNYSEILQTPDLSVFALAKDLENYVTLNTEQTIAARKNFLNGLSVGGLGITKSQDDVIYLDANLVVRGGITMYAEGTVDVPSIIDSLPVASTTAKGIASFDSAYFSVDSDGKVTLLAENVGLNETELAAYLTSKGYATQAWVTSKGYALSADLNALQAKIDDFLEGSDTDAIINKWKELELFLEGLHESDNLATILGTKANQSDLDETNKVVATKWTQDDDKITKWNTAYNWGNHSVAGYALKSYVDDNFVTFTKDETISGVKTFTNGIKIGTSSIKQSQSDVVYVDANLVVRGGITMYSDNTVDVGSIYDGLPIDGTTIYWGNGKLKANITEGVITNITSAMVVEALGYTPYNSSNPKGYISGITSDMVVSALGYTPLQNHQTIYTLTIQKNGTAVGTYTPNSAKKTINIVVPTKVSELDNDNEYATTSDLDTRISELINGAPAAYDTLKEIADVLAGNVDSIGDIITTLGTKADKAIKISAGTGLSGGGTLEADRTLSLATSGVTAGTYKSVTVDKYGRVTKGTNPTTLAGYGITDAYTKTNVDDLLKLYVTLAGTQTITGEKNFTGGLKVNGSPIVYDATNKYWKLEGDLLVTGGVTMFASDSSFTPSTIMNGVVVDGVTIGKRASDGALYFIGETGGGLTEVYWNDIKLKPTFASVATSGKYSDLSGKPTLLSSFIDDFVQYNYLPLSGGQITGRVEFKTNSIYGVEINRLDSKSPVIHFCCDGNSYGYIGFDSANTPTYYDNGFRPNTILHTGNWTKYISAVEIGAYLPQSGGNMSGHIFMTGAVADSSIANTSQLVFGTPANNHVCLTSNMKGLIINPSLTDTSGQIALYADAGMESFIRSSLKVYGNLYASVYFNYGGSIAQSYSSSMYVWDNNLQINKTTISNDYLKTIMSFDLINEDIEININGELSLNSYIIWKSDSNNPYMAITYGGRNWYLQAYNNAYIYLGIGIDASIRIDTAGNLLTAGGITMYSDIRKKTKLQDVELSLKQIADAPLIEHYYNSDSNKTTHVGSIAQYWAGMNDWFCKLDSEGFYTMEIQNAALASAISIARELVKYESKTDRTIRKLKQRISELEDKIEKLENK